MTTVMMTMVLTVTMMGMNMMMPIIMMTQWHNFPPGMVEVGVNLRLLEGGRRWRTGESCPGGHDDDDDDDDDDGNDYDDIGYDYGIGFDCIGYDDDEEKR